MSPTYSVISDNKLMKIVTTEKFFESILQDSNLKVNSFKSKLKNTT